MGSDSGRVAHPYGELIELAERERELIERRDYGGLAELVESRDELMSKLPDAAPDSAHEAIARLVDLQRRNDAAMEQASGGLSVELSRLRSGRAGVRRYNPAQPTAKRLDYSA